MGNARIFFTSSQERSWYDIFYNYLMSTFSNVGVRSHSNAEFWLKMTKVWLLQHHLDLSCNEIKG